MSTHPFDDNRIPNETREPRAETLWSKHARRLRHERLLHKQANHVHLSRVPSTLGDIAVSVPTYPDFHYRLTLVDTWSRPVAFSVLGSHLLDAFDARTSTPPSAPRDDVHGPDGSLLFGNVPTLSLGDLTVQVGYDTRVEE